MKSEKNSYRILLFTFNNGGQKQMQTCDKEREADIMQELPLLSES
jgi:hypothetical protein